MTKVNADEIVDAAKYRFCCRTFTDKKISDNDFYSLMEASRWTPSPFGIEPWKILVITDDKLREKLSPALIGAQKGQLRTSSHFLVIFAAGQKWLDAQDGKVYDFFEKIQKQPPRSMTYFHNTLGSFYPSIGLVDDKTYTTYATRSCHILLGNILTNAAHMRIDTACMEGVDGEKMKELLKDSGLIDNDMYTAVLAIALGYRDKEPDMPRIKMPLSDILIYPDHTLPEEYKPKSV